MRLSLIALLLVFLSVTACTSLVISATCTGCSPLTVAILQNDSPKATKYINDNKFVDEKALLTAIARNNKPIIRALLDHDASINRNGKSLHQAVIYSDMEVFKLLLDRGADVTYVEPNGSSILTAAAGMGKLDVVKLLVTNGADVNQLDGRGESALFRAAQSGHAEVVSFLLQSGANKSLANTNGRTALYTALYGGYTQVVDLLYEGSRLDVNKPLDQDALRYAIMNGQSHYLEYLLINSRIDNKTDALQSELLHMSAMTGNIAISTLLIRGGAVPTIVTNSLEDYLGTAVAFDLKARDAAEKDNNAISTEACNTALKYYVLSEQGFSSLRGESYFREGAAVVLNGLSILIAAKYSTSLNSSNLISTRDERSRRDLYKQYLSSIQTQKAFCQKLVS